MTATINVRTDANLKENALRVFNALGLDMSTAINVFLAQVVRRNAIPFELTLTSPVDGQKETLLSLFGCITDPSFGAHASSFESVREVIE